MWPPAEARVGGRLTTLAEGLGELITKADMIRKVGERTYLDACASARRDSARADFGRGMGWGGPLADIPHQVTDLIWDGDWPWRDKLRL